MFLTYLWVAGIIVTIGGFVVRPREQASTFFLVGFVLLSTAFSKSYKKFKRTKRITAASANVSYDEESQVLTVFSCLPSNKEILKVHAMLDVGYKYHDAELVYTGATVGRVHMGGFHVNKAYLSGRIQGKTGKYQLLYTGIASKEGFFPIKEIVVTKEMVAKAKMNPAVAGFLDGKRKRLILKHDAKSTVSEEMNKVRIDSYKQGRLDIATEIGKQDYINTQLTKEECEAIVSFLVTE